MATRKTANTKKTSTMKTDKKWLAKWFKKRGLDERGYQFDAILEKLDAIHGSLLPIVLAMCPNAGKTLISIAYIEKYLINNPKHRVLVLTHGQTMLRTQYYKVISDLKPAPAFSKRVIKKGQAHELANSTEQVIITLPQTICRLEKLPKFDLIVVDEAHHYFLKEMVQNIIQKAKIQHKILLTGTPYEYVKRQYKVISFSVMELYAMGNCSYLTPKLFSSSYRFKNSDYLNDELKEKTKIDKKHTNKILDNILKSLTRHLKNGAKLDKTIIACTNAQMAKQVYNYFSKTQYKTAISTAEIDGKSAEIKNFLEDKELIILIVLKRGILGFNFKELINAVDLTMSKNVDRTFQFMCRVLRRHPDDKKKIFIKVAPHNFYNDFWTVMKAVGCMCIKELYEVWNGKNFVGKELPMEFGLIEILKEKEEDDDNSSEENSIDDLDVMAVLKQELKVKGEDVSSIKDKPKPHPALIINGMPLLEILIKTTKEIKNKNLNERDWISFEKLKNIQNKYYSRVTYEDLLKRAIGNIKLAA